MTDQEDSSPKQLALEGTEAAPSAKPKKKAAKKAAAKKATTRKRATKAEELGSHSTEHPSVQTETPSAKLGTSTDSASFSPSQKRSDDAAVSRTQERQEAQPLHNSGERERAQRSDGAESMLGTDRRPERRETDQDHGNFQDSRNDSPRLAQNRETASQPSDHQTSDQPPLRERARLIEGSAEDSRSEERPQPSERGDRPNRGGRFESRDRSDRDDRSYRGGRDDRNQIGEGQDRADREDRRPREQTAEHRTTDEPESTNREGSAPDQADRPRPQGRQDRPDRGERPERGDRPERSDRGERNDRGDRGDRGDRNDRDRFGKKRFERRDGPGGPTASSNGPGDNGPRGQSFGQGRGDPRRSDGPGGRGEPGRGEPGRGDQGRSGPGGPPFDRGGKKGKFEKGGKGGKRAHWQNDFAAIDDEELEPPVTNALIESGLFISDTALAEFRAAKIDPEAPTLDYAELSALKLGPLVEAAHQAGLKWEGSPTRRKLLAAYLADASEKKRAIRAKGLVEIAEEGYGFLVFSHDNYRLKTDSPFLPPSMVQRNNLQRGHEVEVDLHAPLGSDTCPFISHVHTVMGRSPAEIEHLTPFKELTAYYPTTRILMEAEQGGLKKWDNISMRVVDMLSPIGLGQRGLIVAPPRTGKTVLLQGIANSIRVNTPDARLIILLVDERPEEVTDFKRSVAGAEVIASTFDEAAESHVHAAEMVCEKARRLVEVGEDVIILLDSITRLARAYNTMQPSSGKILSGGVEANALQKPKRFFGSARKVEEGGSLTILATALVETGSKMDEVIFEEFKGTGNLELHLDRDLSNKRIFPALSFEKSGTRKEELLYHPDEMEKVYALRRAMKGVPSTEAMEMLIQRIKKTATNAQFLMALQR